jgi:hypothetical protein
MYNTVHSDIAIRLDTQVHDRNVYIRHSAREDIR